MKRGSLLPAVDLVPPATPRLVCGSPLKDLRQLALTDDEVAQFQTDLKRIGGMQSFERDLTPLLLNDQDEYLYALSVAKATVGTEPTFAGVRAHGGDLGMQLIRAVTVRNAGIAGGGTPVIVWDKAYGVAGWGDVFGSATAPVDLSQQGSSGNSATNELNRVLLAFGGLVNDKVPPLLAEYRFHLGPLDFSTQSVSWQFASDFAYAQLFGVVLIPANTRFYMRGNIQAAGTDGTQLYGLAFGIGDYLQAES